MASWLQLRLLRNLSVAFLVVGDKCSGHESIRHVNINLVCDLVCCSLVCYIVHLHCCVNITVSFFNWTSTCILEVKAPRIWLHCLIILTFSLSY
jgi:hypothetical protein